MLLSFFLHLNFEYSTISFNILILDRNMKDLADQIFKTSCRQISYCEFCNSQKCIAQCFKIRKIVKLKRSVRKAKINDIFFPVVCRAAPAVHQVKKKSHLLQIFQHCVQVDSRYQELISKGVFTNDVSIFLEIFDLPPLSCQLFYTIMSAIFGYF